MAPINGTCKLGKYTLSLQKGCVARRSFQLPFGRYPVGPSNQLFRTLRPALPHPFSLTMVSLLSLTLPSCKHLPQALLSRKPSPRQQPSQNGAVRPEECSGHHLPRRCLISRYLGESREFFSRPWSPVMRNTWIPQVPEAPASGHLRGV